MTLNYKKYSDAINKHPQNCHKIMSLDCNTNTKQLMINKFLRSGNSAQVIEGKHCSQTYKYT